MTRLMVKLAANDKTDKVSGFEDNSIPGGPQPLSRGYIHVKINFSQTYSTQKWLVQSKGRRDVNL